jgi:hypothetical protein
MTIQASQRERPLNSWQRQQRDPAERDAGVMTSTAVEVPRFTRVFRGRADQVRQARLEVARYLSGCGGPVTDDVTLVVSDSLNNQRELEGSDVAAGQVNRATVKARLGW